MVTPAPPTSRLRAERENSALLQSAFLNRTLPEPIVTLESLFMIHFWFCVFLCVLFLSPFSNISPKKNTQPPHRLDLQDKSQSFNNRPPSNFRFTLRCMLTTFCALLPKRGKKNKCSLTTRRSPVDFSARSSKCKRGENRKGETGLKRQQCLATLKRTTFWPQQQNLGIFGGSGP